MKKEKKIKYPRKANGRPRGSACILNSPRDYAQSKEREKRVRSINDDDDDRPTDRPFVHSSVRRSRGRSGGKLAIKNI